MPKYPFTPELLDALPEELAELFRGLELTLLEEICSRLKAADQLNEVTVQDIRALRSHGISLEEIKKAIRETAKIADDKLDKLFDDVISRNQKYYTSVIDLAKITAPVSLVNAADIDIIRRQAFDEMRNLTRSMGFLVDGGRTMIPPAKAYQWALDNAVLQVQSGAINYNTAIRSAVKQLADSGLVVDNSGRKNYVQYESGHRDQLDVAIRRAVMTGVNQINQKYREQSMDYLETDLVEVTAHIGARDIDGPKGWENHKAWQGKIYRWKRNADPVEKDVTSEYLDSATPGNGQIVYANGYNNSIHVQETKTAQWLHAVLGGDIKLLNESNISGVKRADYLWKNRLWDLKSVSSPSSADSALRSGIKQIFGNPGGIILDYGKTDINLDSVVSIVSRRMMRSKRISADVMIVSNNKILKVLRYIK